MPLTVRVLSLAQLLDGAAEGSDAVLSVRDTAARDACDELEVALAQAVLGEVGAVLPLWINDVGLPSYGPYAGASEEQIAAALDVVLELRRHQPDAVLIVHGVRGRSRFAALALMALAEEHWPGRERDSVDALFRLDVEEAMVPNPLVVRWADSALWRFGALDRCLAESNPRYAAVRERWEHKAINPRSPREFRR